MPTLFENLTDSFYSAFFEPDAEKRRASIDAWILEATPAVQAAIENELRSFVETLLKDAWTPGGWQSQAQKFVRPFNGNPLMDCYRLGLDIRLRQGVSVDTVVGERSEMMRERTIKAAREVLPESKPAAPKAKKPVRAADEYLFEEDSEQRAYNSPSRDDFPDEESWRAALGQ